MESKDTLNAKKTREITETRGGGVRPSSPAARCLKPNHRQGGI